MTTRAKREALGAGPGERTEGRRAYRAGYDSRGLVTRIGKLELRVPGDRDGRFSTVSFARYERSEKALVRTLAEIYVQGVSTRMVKAITEELCGPTFSARTISRINASLDGMLRRVAERRLDEAYTTGIRSPRREERLARGGLRRLEVDGRRHGLQYRHPRTTEAYQ